MRTRKEKQLQRVMVTVNLEDYIAEDDELRGMKAEIDTSFVNGKVEGCYKDSERGALPEDPERIFLLLVAMIKLGIRSQRQLEQDARTNLRIRWFSDFEIQETVPDHSTISKFRKRLGSEKFDECLSEIVKQCIEKGYIDNQAVSTDRTKMDARETSLTSRERSIILTREVIKVIESAPKAEEILGKEGAKNLSNTTKNTVANIIADLTKVNKRSKRFVLEEIKELLEKEGDDEQQAEDKVEPSNPGGAVREEEKKRTRKDGKELLPDWEVEKKKQKEVVEAILKKEVNEKEVKLGNPEGDGREEKKRARKKGKQLLADWEIEKEKGEEVVEAILKGEVNEKEVQRALEEAVKDMPQARAGTAAKFGHTSVKDKFFGYNANLIMDHKEEIITAIKLDDGDERGNEHFEENYEKHKERCGVTPKSMRADSEYDTKDVRELLEEDGVVSYISQSKPKGPHKDIPFSEFKLNEEGDIVCPSGKLMESVRKNKDGKEVFRGKDCAGCELKQRCCKDKEARIITICREDLKRYLEVKAFNQSDEYKQEIKKRMRLEARIGHGKTYHHMGKSMYTDKDMITIQLILTAIVLNMERMARIAKRKRRKYG